MTELFFGDLQVGTTRDLGSETVERAEMVAFAERYDPQLIHTEEVAAEETAFGGLIASGWYTASVCMRRLVDAFLTDVESVAAVGLEELTWYKPLRPGDEVEVSCEILDLSDSETRDDRGTLTLHVTGSTGGEKLISWTSVSLVRKALSSSGT